jgi:hypothetical protein
VTTSGPAGDGAQGAAGGGGAATPPGPPLEPALAALLGEDTAEELAAQWEAERPPPVSPAANLGAAVVVIGLGAAALVASLGLGRGSLDSPAAGTWPLLLSAVLILLGIGLALTARITTDTERFSRNSWLVVAGLVSVLPFAALLPVIGFEIPTLLLAFVWLKLLGRESWRVSIVGSLAMTVALYLVFVAALGVNIPHLF